MREKFAVPEAQCFAASDVKVSNELDFSGICISQNDCYGIMLLRQNLEKHLDLLTIGENGFAVP